MNEWMNVSNKIKTFPWGGHALLKIDSWEYYGSDTHVYISTLHLHYRIVIHHIIE